MSFTPRAWFDKYVLKAADLIDMETRLAAYADSVGGGTGYFTVVRASGGDDTSLFDAAVTSLPTKGGTIFLPDAQYKITHWAIPAAPKTITVIGMGIASTNIKSFTTAIAADTNMIEPPCGATLRMRDLTLEGPTSVGTNKIFCLVKQNSGTPGGGVLNFERVRFYRYGYGIWSEDEEVRCSYTIFDGGDGGNGLGGGAAAPCTGLQQAYTGTGRCFLDDCLFTDNGVSASNQHHGTYFKAGVSVLARNTTFTRLWGTGFQSQHNGSSVAGIESKYTDCYFGPAASTNAAQGMPTAVGMILTLKNCTFDTPDTALYLQQNTKVNLYGCYFNGTAGTGNINFTDTGIEVYADGCVFNNVPGNYEFYLFNNTCKLTVKNSRFIGAAPYDVNVLTGLSGVVVVMEGNEHTGATSGALRFTSGDEATIRNCRFKGSYSDAAIRNNTASSLGILNLFDNDFSQGSGSSVVLTVAPTTFRARGNYGSTGYKTEGGAVFTSTPGAVSTLNIAHGLSQTPTIMQVEPNNTNARGAPLYSVTADSTNVILTFASNLTAATSYSWNWLARYQP